MQEVDLTGVDPVRRSETLRRVEVIRRYLDIDEPNGEDADGCAAELGIRRVQFLTLVRAWLLHGQASALPGAQRRLHLLRRHQWRRLDPRVALAIDEAIAALGAHQTFARILREARRRCADAGLPPPSLNALRARVEEARREAPFPVGDPTLVIFGRCATDLPVQVDGVVMPVVVALAVSPASGHVLAFDVGTGDRPGSVGRTLLELAALSDPTAPPSRLGIALARGSERRVLAEALRIAGLSGAVSWIGRDDPAKVQTVLGGRLGPLRLSATKRKGVWSMKASLNADASRPLDLTDASEVVSAAVHAHNSEQPRGNHPAPVPNVGDPTTAVILGRLLEAANP